MLKCVICVSVLIMYASLCHFSQSAYHAYVLVTYKSLNVSLLSVCLSQMLESVICVSVLIMYVSLCYFSQSAYHAYVLVRYKSLNVPFLSVCFLYALKK